MRMEADRFMKKRMLFGIVLLLTMLTFGFGLLETKASALAGTGTESDPYIVMSYEQLHNCLGKDMDGTNTYIKLGDDITSYDERNSYWLVGVGSQFSDKGGRVFDTYYHLDLAGHKVVRVAQTKDNALVFIPSNTHLEINDSVGGGGIEGSLDCSLTRSVFYVSGEAELTINAGNFCLLDKTTYATYCVENMGGNIVINGGYFADNLNAIKNLHGSITINGGTFQSFNTVANREGALAISGENLHAIINECTILTQGDEMDAVTIGGTYNGEKKYYSYIKTHMGQYTTVKVNDMDYVLNDKSSRLKGKKVEFVRSYPENSIKKVEISGIDEPVVGMPYDDTVEVTCDNKELNNVEVIWVRMNSDNSGDLMKKDDVFEKGYVYRCEIKLSDASKPIFPFEEKLSDFGYTYNAYLGEVFVNGEELDHKSEVICDELNQLVVPWWMKEATQLHSHVYKDEWDKDEAKHWKECECGDKIDVANHDFDVETRKEPKEIVKTYTCKICGYKKQERLLNPQTPEPDKGKNDDTPKGNASSFDKNDENNDDSVQIIDYAKKEASYVLPKNTKKKVIVVPAAVKVNGITYKVTKINNNAFANNNYVEKIVLPSTIKQIGKSSFAKCTKLKTINLPNKLTQIGANAFKNCLSLTKITIPAKVKKIGANAFRNCKKLKTIKVKTKYLTMKSVGKNAFKSTSKKGTMTTKKSKLKSYKKIMKKRGFKGKYKS